MRILFLTQWFQPEPHFKGLPFVRKMKERGHEVEVLTGFPNYPGGKLYPGYRVRLFQKEIIDGIRVNRVVLFPSHDRSGFKRIMNYLIFSLSAALLGPLLVRKPDVIYVYNLITLSWAALVMKHISGCKIVYDVQDLWPESVINSGILSNRFLLNVLNRWCVWAYCRADRLAVLSPGFKRALIERGVPRERIEVVYNWCDSTNWESRKRDNDLAHEWRILDT